MMIKRAGISSKMKRLPVAAALATMLSASGGALAAVIDTFNVSQGPVIDTTIGGEVTDATVTGRTVGALMTADSGAGIQISANISTGVFAQNTDANVAGTTRVTWVPAWGGFVSDLSSTTSISVSVINWGSGAGESLAITLTDGVNTGTVTDSSVAPNSVVVFNMADAGFTGVNLAAVTEITMTLADATDDGSELDATIDLVQTITPAAPPPVIPPGAGVPILPPLGMAFAAFGLAGIGAWRSRRKKSAK